VLLPNLKKGLASCETKKGSSLRYTRRTFSSELFKFRRQENRFVLKLPYLEGLFEISKDFVLNHHGFLLNPYGFVPNPHGILLNLVDMVT
jgi:hypothetical protein